MTIFQKKEDNPIIRPCKKKNYLAPNNKNIVALDVECEPQIYRKIILGSKGE